MSQHNVVLLLGSNLGNVKNNIIIAKELITNKIGEIKKTSDFLTTFPVEFVSCNNFCNIALRINTFLSPFQLLKVIKNIENEMGRIKDSKEEGVYTDRIIDIDIVTYDNLIFESKNLVIPHKKHLYERDFSRKLLSEIN